ncbi:MAG: hypothetical protein RR501_09045 [Cloacibacillus sp.]
MKKIISAAAALCLLFVPAAAACAAPVYDYYYHHNRDDGGDGWKSAAIGSGIGLLLRAIANSSSAQGNSAMMRQSQNAMQTEADNQQSNIARLISRQGPAPALQTLVNYWRGAGQSALLAAGRPISILSVTGFPQQPQLAIRYTINEATDGVTVAISNPSLQQSAESTGTYALPFGYNPFSHDLTQAAR